MKLLDTFKKSAILASALLILFGLTSPLAAQDNQSEFNTWDSNSDSTLSQDEFSTGLSDMGYYDEWDSDTNGEISEEEWNTGVEENLGNMDSEAIGEFSEWDLDDDGILSEDEFDNGLFDAIDENDDDLLDEDEFDSWYEDGLF